MAHFPSVGLSSSSQNIQTCSPIYKGCHLFCFLNFYSQYICVRAPSQVTSSLTRFDSGSHKPTTLSFYFSSVHQCIASAPVLLYTSDIRNLNIPFRDTQEDLINSGAYHGVGESRWLPVRCFNLSCLSLTVTDGCQTGPRTKRNILNHCSGTCRMKLTLHILYTCHLRQLPRNKVTLLQRMVQQMVQ